MTTSINDYVHAALSKVKAQSGLSFEPAEMPVSGSPITSRHVVVAHKQLSPANHSTKNTGDNFVDDLDKQRREIVNETNAIKALVRESSATTFADITKSMNADNTQSDLPNQAASPLVKNTSRTDSAKQNITAQIVQIVHPAEVGAKIKDEKLQSAAKTSSALVQLYGLTLDMQDIDSKVAQPALKARHNAKIRQYKLRLERLQDLLKEQVKDIGQISTDISSNLYDKYYTEDELRDLLAFYKSPIGQAYLQAQPNFQDEVNKEISNYIETVEDAIYKQMDREGFKLVGEIRSLRHSK